MLGWQVAVGDTLTVNQIMVEIETAKAAVELPSPYAGRVHALLVEPGVTVDVGTPIITVDTDPDAGELPEVAGRPDGGRRTARPPATVRPPERRRRRQDRRGDRRRPDRHPGRLHLRPAARHRPAAAAAARRPARRRRRPAGRAAAAVRRSRAAGAGRGSGRSHAPLATPPVRKLAKDLGIDLAAVPRQPRPDGVITRADVEKAAAAERLSPAAVRAPGRGLRPGDPRARGSRSRASGRRPPRPWWPARSPRRTSPSSSPSTSPR